MSPERFWSLLCKNVVLLGSVSLTFTDNFKNFVPTRKNIYWFEYLLGFLLLRDFLYVSGTHKVTSM